MASIEMKPFTESHWDAFAGSESFANGRPPFAGEVDLGSVNEDGEQLSAVVVYDRNGVTAFVVSAGGDEVADFDWHAPQRGEGT